MISSRYAQSKKKRKIIFSRKKIMHGGQIVPINTLQTYVYVNLNVTGSTVSVNNITNSLVKSIATNTPGSIILSVDPSLSTLADYTLFGYNSDTSAWAEIPRTNIDVGGSSVALYGNVPGMLIRKQADATPQRASMEISIPVPASTYGNIMQFVNITDSIFEFTATNSPVTATNVYIQLIFTNSYATTGTLLSGWVPTFIPGLSLWLNAGEPGNGTFTPNTGVKMTSWADKSGKNNHASAASNTAPLYQFLSGGVGMGMYFNGSTFFSGNMQATGKYSYTFSVARPDSASPASGRLLSLGATGIDDSKANTSMGVAASAAGLTTPATPMLVIGMGAPSWSNVNKSIDGGATWISWPASTIPPTNSSVSSIAYNGYMYVAVGDDGSANGRIQYSLNGSFWSMTNPPAGYATNYGFSYSTAAPSPSWVGNGGIKVVIYTGTMWICGGRGTNGSPAMAYSYDGINWILNTTTLPFTGAGDCIRSIATNGKMLILAGFLKPSMAYSYDGINWFAMPAGATTATQIATAPDYSGIHCVAWSSGYNMWIAAGDGGNPTGTMAAADANKKIVFSLDGFTWNPIANSGTSILADGIGTIYSAAFSITRIFSFNVNGVPTLLLSGPTPFNNRGALGPLISTAQTPTTANPYGFKFTNCGGFPINGSAPAEVSAAYASGSNIYVGLQTVSGSSYLFSSTNNGSSWTAVTGISGSGPINAFLDNTNPNQNFQVNSYLNGASTTASIKDTTTTLPYIVSAWTDGANTCVAINGTQVPVYKVNPAQFNISSYMIGKNQGTNYNNYTGYIYEIVNCSGAMYAVARTVIEGYLAWKWAIQSLLPASHPFYTKAPTKYSILTPWPLILTDLMPILWLDGQDPNGTEIAPPDRTLISTWYDKSGKGKNLTAPSGSEPMFRTNVLSGGAIQFNRYPYQSMSILPVPIATDTLPTTATTTATNWIPGLYVPISASTTYARPNVTAYYNGFIFFAVNTFITINQYLVPTSFTTVLMQYDETNCQTRLLYSIASSLATGIYINSTTGIIFFVTTTGLSVLSPSALPITTSTTYTIVGTPLLDPSSTAISNNLGGIVADGSGNVYIWPSTNFNNLYRFSLSNYTATSWTATISYPIAISINSNPFFAYSAIDNSISYASTQSLRCVIYLSTCVIFSGTVAGTTLTVSFVGSGTLQLGMMFFYCSANAGTVYFYTITALGTGTGALGTYTVSGGTITAAQGITTTAMGAIATDTSFVSAYVQLGSSSTTATTDRTQDGLFNASATTLNATDPVANSAYTNYGNDAGNNFFYDPVGNYLLFSDGYLTDPGNSQRIKRVNLSTRQMTTIAGPVNNITNTATTIVPVKTERFPSVYESGSTTVYDTPFSSGSNKALSLIGNNTFYVVESYNRFPNIPVTGIQLWFDGADPLGTGITPSNGATVATWVDKSGNGYNTTSAVGTVTYASASQSLTFNGSSYYLLPNGSIPYNDSSYSMYFVASVSNFSAIINTLLTGGANLNAGGVLVGPMSNKVSHRWHGGYSGNTTDTITAGTNFLYSAAYTTGGGTAYSYLNGTSQPTFGVPTRSQPVGGNSIGYAPFPNYIINGTISEILVYNVNHTTQQRQQVEGYLASKWGMQLTSNPYAFPSYFFPNINILSFNPKSIPGIQLWLDGSDPLATGTAPADGTSITSWKDKSGNGYHVTGTGTNTYVSASTNIAMSAGYFVSPIITAGTFNTAISIFAVYRNTLGSGYGPLITRSTSGSVWGFPDMFATNRIYGTAGGTSVTSSYNLLNATTSLFEIIINQPANTVSEWSNGNVNTLSASPPAVPATPDSGFNTIYIGARGNLPGTGPFTGNFSEILIYNTALTTTQRQSIEGYLTWKWGLQASLPVGHPYCYASFNTLNSTRADKLTNFRATPSCMSGPLTISGPTVSVFIVYINKNTSKAILPHRTAYNTPILSLSTTSDYTVFTGYIRGTVLTITAVTSGTIQLGATLNTPLGGIIVSLASGTLGAANSTYNISIPQIVASGTIKCSNGIDAINSTVTGTTGATVTGAADTNSASYISLYAKGGGTTVYRNNSATGFAASTSTDIASASPAVWPDSALPTVFMGTISGTTLTVTNMISGCIQVGAVLNIGSNVTITALVTGNGTNLGTYTISVSQTVATATNMTATMPPVLPDLLFYSCSASAVNTRLNGAATTTNSSSGSLNVSAIGLGLQPSNISRKDALLPNYFFDGVVCEVLVYNTDLTTDNLRLNLMEGYLAWKWGIQSKLAATHLYKTLLPTDFIAAAPSAITSTTLVYAYDISFAVSWSGGNGATTYNYSLSLTNGGPAITTAKFIDKGLDSKSVIVYNLSGNTTYWLTINANSTLKSTSRTASFTTKSWVLTVPYGLYGVANGVYYAGGPFNASQRDGIGVDTTFSSSSSMTIDMYDNIYMYESYAVNRIRIVSLSTNIVYAIPYVELGATGGTANILVLAVDKNGIIYVNNRNGTIMKMVPNTYPLTNNGTSITTTWTTTKFISASSTTVPTGAPTITSGVSTNTDNFGIAVDSLNNLYFIDVSGSNYSLKKLDVNNNNTITVISGVNSTIASNICLMCFDPFNNLWASLKNLNKILMVTPNGNATIYGSGNAYSSNGPLSNFDILTPMGISSDKNGTIYVTVGNQYQPIIRRITSGNVDTVLGDSTITPNLPAAFQYPNLSANSPLPIPGGGTFLHSFYGAYYNTVDSNGNLYNMPQHIICKLTLT